MYKARLKLYKGHFDLSFDLKNEYDLFKHKQRLFHLFFSFLFILPFLLLSSLVLMLENIKYSSIVIVLVIISIIYILFFKIILNKKHQYYFNLIISQIRRNGWKIRYASEKTSQITYIKEDVDYSIKVYNSKVN